MDKQQILEELTKREKDCSAAESSAHNRQNYDFATNMHGHAAAYRQAIQLVEKLDTWTYLIDDKGRAVEGAELPHNGRMVDITFYRPALTQLGTHVAQHKMGRWVYCESGDAMPVGQDTFIIVAWRERPAPAPYPVREEE